MYQTQRKVGLALAGSLILILSACDTGTGSSTTPVAAAKDKLKILVGGMSKQIYLPNELTKQLGFFDEQNLDVQLIDEASGQSAEEEVLSGGVDAGSGSYNHTLEIQAKGKGLTEVVQLLISPGEAEMVSSKQADTVKSITDLKGKNLGVTELGSGTQTLTQYMLTQKGISSDQVHFVPVGAGDTFIAGMKQGTIDAGMTTEPTISRLLQSGDAKVLIDLRTPDATRAALGADYPFICVFMKTEYVSAHKDIVQRMVNAYVKTLKWIHSHTPEEVAAKMPPDYYAGNQALYTTALTSQYAMYSPDGKMPESGPPFVLKFEQAINADVKAATIDLSKTFTNEFADNAK
ncbi:MAG: ABC transporter substrate-binding protein [Chloroflexota bacterium]|nr:ABC transporter substrate-binding protein [Chloroflexota bacterium]